MYTISANQEITKEVLKDMIDYNEDLKERFLKLENYYLGKHEILNREKIPSLKNNKVVVNHAKYITDINTGYLLGNPVEYQVGAGYNIDAILDLYKKQTISDEDHEVAKDTSKFGMQYEYTFAVGNDVRSKELDNKNCIIAYDDTVDHNKLFAVVYELNGSGNEETRYEAVQVMTADRIIDWASNKKLRKGREIPHYFGKVPVVAFRNNEDLLGDYETVLTLIDAYNLLASDRVNDKEQLVDAILALYGFTMGEEELTALKNNRILANLPKDGKAEYLSKVLNESEITILRKDIENDIHKISMTPNMGDENFVGNSSGVAIRFKLLPFEQSIKSKERYFEKGLLERFELYNNYLNALNKKNKIVPIYEVDVVFKRNLPQNDFETSQMILNLLGTVDTERLISQLSFVPNAKEAMETLAKEKKAKTQEGSSGFGTLNPNENTSDNSNQNANDLNLVE